MKRALVLLLLASISLCACKTGSSQIETGNETGLESGDTVSDNGVIDERYSEYAANRIIWEEDIPFSLPKPNATSFYKFFESLHCTGMTEKDFADYMIELENHGWILMDNLNFSYIKDNTFFNIHNFTSKENGRRIVIYYRNGYSGPERGLSKSEAIALIQQHIENKTGSESLSSDKCVQYIVELNIPEAFEKMELQAYIAYEADGNDLGRYLICRGKVLYVYDWLDSTCVADIDKDGEYELVSIYSYGSGINGIALCAYKLGDSPNTDIDGEELYVAYGNGMILNKWSGHLVVKKISETEVKLFNSETNTFGEQKLTKDYGLIYLEDIYLKIANTEDFQFSK